MLLRELASAINNQTMEAFEWVVIINGPISDQQLLSIKNVVAIFPRINLVLGSKIPGIIDALNLGLRSSNGDYITVVDADDLISLDTIKVLSSEINFHNSPALLYSDEDLLVNGECRSPYLRGDFDPILSFENSVIWHLCAFRRDIALQLDCFGSNLANWCQDWDVISRVSAQSELRIVHIPIILYHWRQHSGSTTNNDTGDSRSLDSTRYVLERHIQGLNNKDNFYVDYWPFDRGSKELYIARKNVQLPKYCFLSDVEMLGAIDKDVDILALIDPDIEIDFNKIFHEAVRIFELHPHVGIVGGIVINDENKIIDAPLVQNKSGAFKSPWLGKFINDGGHYALLHKPQRVSLSTPSISFVRISGIRDSVSKILGMNFRDCGLILADILLRKNFYFAFSPLIIGISKVKNNNDLMCVNNISISNQPLNGIVRYE